MDVRDVISSPTELAVAQVRFYCDDSVRNLNFSLLRGDEADSSGLLSSTTSSETLLWSKLVFVNLFENFSFFNDISIHKNSFFIDKTLAELRSLLSGNPELL